MNNPRTAKLFANGASQAVRLPADFRFSGDEVFISRDEVTGDVILSTRPGAHVWSGFFAELERLNVPDTFMNERPLNTRSSARGVFDDDLPASSPKASPRKRSAKSKK